MIGPCNSAANYNKRNTITDDFLSKKRIYLNLISLNFCIHSFCKFIHKFNVTHAGIIANLSCEKYIRSINLSSASKNLLIIQFMLFYYSNFFSILKQNTNCNLTLNITLT